MSIVAQVGVIACRMNHAILERVHFCPHRPTQIDTYVHRSRPFVSINVPRLVLKHFRRVKLRPVFVVAPDSIFPPKAGTAPFPRHFFGADGINELRGARSLSEVYDGIIGNFPQTPPIPWRAPPPFRGTSGPLLSRLYRVPAHRGRFAGGSEVVRPNLRELHNGVEIPSHVVGDSKRIRIGPHRTESISQDEFRRGSASARPRPGRRESSR
mmetsp:Transcript_36566/g.109898  ORF Transcript_36566/g.109898 Transcript_36566/m.109898 type:complete len:211 (+) Transcript_36566:521-1153(+)